METVTIYAQSCSLANVNAFGNNSKLTNIYVFSDVVDDYKAASNWSTYESKIQAIPALSANEGASNTEYWTTYYNDLTCATAPEGTQVFKVALNGSTLTLTEISDGVINMGEGVVLKSNSPSITLASAASTGTTADGGYEGNVLTGTMNSITNPGNAYVLNKTDENGEGFYKLSSGGTIGANKAYLAYDGDLARGFFGFDEATGIAPIDNGQWIMEKEYMKPVMNVERIQQQHIICASQDQYGMNKSLQSEETVDAAWSRQGGSIISDGSNPYSALKQRVK